LRHRVKKQVKTKVHGVVLTFCTLGLRFLLRNRKAAKNLGSEGHGRAALATAKAPARFDVSSTVTLAFSGFVGPRNPRTSKLLRVKKCQFQKCRT